MKLNVFFSLLGVLSFMSHKQSKKKRKRVRKFFVKTKPNKIRTKEEKVEEERK